METFAPPRSLVEHTGFAADRDRALADLSPGIIDAPIRSLITGLADIDCCFTLQSCHGHFVHAGQPDAESLAPPPEHVVDPVTWRIAYLALCVRNDAAGRRLLTGLADIPALDPAYIQFGSPDWFWERQPNSFALQVEPTRFAHLDQAVVDATETRHLARTRDRFFLRLDRLVRKFHD